ncbi:MAG: cupredoxin domain-containing protein [Candidatus Vogelbacteria bacterium]|nr:cupredoxin domain-containing protein [Candidatus Vogelbacteria bacterium]
MKSKSNGALYVLAGAILFATLIVIWGGSVQSGTTETPSVENVSVENGKQIVQINAKGGFLPRLSEAKAGVPTILRVDTNGTYDCSSSVRIPSLRISKNLPATATTDIDLGISKEGILDGTCGMGMYPFRIEFKS